MTTEQEQTLQRLYEIRGRLDTHKDHVGLWNELTVLLPSVPRIPSPFSNVLAEFAQGPDRTNWLYRANFIRPTRPRWDKADDVSFLPRRLWETQRHFGRVNKPYTAVFYASLNPVAACTETYTNGPNLEQVRAQERAEAVVGQWAIKAPLNLITMPIPDSAVAFFEDERIKPLAYTKITPETIKKRNANVREASGDEFGFKVLEFFAEAFANHGSEQYMLSTYYADRMFNKEGVLENIEERFPSIDGILYYGLPTGYQQLNLVLQPEVVDAGKLKLEFGLHMVWQHSWDKEQTTFIPYEQNIVIRDGQIKWRNPHPIPTDWSPPHHLYHQVAPS